MRVEVGKDRAHDPPDVRLALKLVDIEELLDELGIETAGRRGPFIDADCPYHEGGGSWAILADGDSKGWHHCFVCGGAGVIDLIAQLKGLLYEEAVDWFKGRFGMDRILYPTAAEVQKLSDQLGRVQTARPFQMPMYMPRGCVAGHQNAIWHLQQVRWYGADAVAVATRYGIAYCLDGYYREAVVVPITVGDRLVGYSAEAITRDRILPGTVTQDRPEGRRRVFPKGFKAAEVVYGLQGALECARAASLDWVVITEGPWDAIRLLEWGYPAIATFGAEFHAAQAAQLIPYFARFLFCFDADLHKPVEKRGRPRFEQRAKEIVGDMARVGFLRLIEDPALYYDGKGDPGGVRVRDTVDRSMQYVTWPA